MDRAAPDTPKVLNLALQGGGSHGAFTWGALDALLAEPRLEIEAISGTSAGAVNAVALASGYATHPQAPRAGARACLTRVWRDIGQWGALGWLPARFGRALWGGGANSEWVAQAQMWVQAFTGLLSPYQTNPLNLNPLRPLLARCVDFEAIQQCGGPRVFVSATQVSSARAAVFSGDGLTMDAVLASTKLRSDPELIEALFDLGHRAATRWLATHLDAVGVRSTVDVAQDYEDEARIGRDAVCPLP